MGAESKGDERDMLGCELARESGDPGSRARLPLSTAAVALLPAAVVRGHAFLVASSSATNVLVFGPMA